MAMTKCSECGHQISDQAAVCPNCGAPRHGAVATSGGGSDRSRFGLFAVLSVVGLFVLLFTPSILGFIPALVAVSCAAISVTKQERGRVGAVIGAAAAVMLLMMPSGGMLTQSPRSAVSVTDIDWSVTPGVTGGQSIFAQARVRNDTDDRIESAVIRITARDAWRRSLKSITPKAVVMVPGGYAFATGYLPYTGKEKSVTAEAIEVTFADGRVLSNRK